MESQTKHLSWQEYFMLVAKTSAMRSKDPNTQVGCIIVNNLNQIVSTGYNGFPRGVDDTKFPWDRTAPNWLDTKYPYVAHAELNAIVSARTDLTNCDAYLTLFPCNDCAKIIIQAGIKTIFYLEDKYEHLDAFIAAKRMFDAAKVSYKRLDDIDVEIKVKNK